MTVVSARPANLGAFVRDAAEARDLLASDVSTMRAAYDSFQTSGSITVANADLMGSDLPGLLERYATNETFVDVVRVAFVNADTGSGPSGVAVADEAYVARAFDRQAAALGLDPAVFSSTPSAITVDEPTLGGVPQTSGFVDDPVCTGSGHFVEQEDDLVWPDRLAVLRWTRTYSSRFVGDGPFGRGWATWASARCTLGAGTVEYRGPDGQQVTAQLDGDGRFVAIGCSARVVPAPGGIDVLWDAHTRQTGQRWRFGLDGLPAAVTGPGLGATVFVHEAGRLTEVRHDGGRSLRLVWDGDRVRELRSSCGRTARYQYDPAGDLIAVQRVAGDRRYDLDDAGRITAMWDADGVRLCLNAYDSDGRVLRQLSPLGRETVLDYQPGRRTIVGDTEGGPETTYIHDEAGRLVRLELATGARFERSFGRMGRCTGAKDIDGSRESRHFDASAITVRDAGGARSVRLDDDGAVAEVEGAGGTSWHLHRRPGEWLPYRITGPEGWFVDVDGSPDSGSVRLTDADGVTYEVRFDGDGNVIARTGPDGGTMFIERHSSGALVALTRPDGGRVEVDVDAAGCWLERRSAMGATRRRTLSPSGRVHEQGDPAGERWMFAYDARGALVEAVDPSGGVNGWDYNTSGRVVRSTHPDETKWTFDYDSLGQLAILTGPTGTRVFHHDHAGRLVSATTAAGRAVQFVHDRWRGTIDVADEDGLLGQVRVDHAGRLVERRDASGATTRIDRDGLGRPVRVLLPGGSRVEQRYSPAGRLVAVDFDDAVTSVDYDASGRPVSITGPGGDVTRLAWDRSGWLAERFGPTGSVDRWVHDLDGRLVAHDVDGGRWRFDYPIEGTVVVTDPLGASVVVGSDWRGLPVVAIDALGREHVIGRDVNGSQVARTDPIGGTATAVADASGRTVVRTDALGHASTIERDAVGRVIERRLASGRVVRFRRTPRGAVREVAVNGRPWITSELDAAGRPLTIREMRAQRIHSLSWTSSGQLAELDTDGRVMAWERDRLGRPLARRIDGFTAVRFERDVEGRVVAFAGDGWAATIERDARGLPVRVVGEGLERRWERDARGRVLGYRELLDGRQRDVRVTRDVMGRAVAVDGTDGRWRFQRDAAGQMIRAAAPEGEWSWTYDEAGRLVHETSSGGERDLEYDAAHRLVAVTDHVGTTVLEVDADGRRGRARGPHDLVGLRWDELGRISDLLRGGSREVAIDFDAFDNPVRIDAEAIVWDPSGRQSTLVAMGNRAVVGIPGLCPGLASGGAVEWLPLDWQGSAATCDVWGWSATATAGARLGYRSELTVGGLVWLGSRWYDPAVRSFVSPDPVAGRVGRPTLAYPYHYADNDPVDGVDPDGRQPLTLADYEAIRADETGFQWDNVAQAALTVGGRMLAAPLEIAVQAAKPLAGVAAVGLALYNGETDLDDLFRHYQNGVPTMLSLGVAATFGHADDISYNDEAGMFVATGVDEPWGGPRAGFTVGSTYLGSDTRTPDAIYLGHESVHADQWAASGGGIGFPIAYGIEEWFNPTTERVRPDGTTYEVVPNRFEQQAGLGAGCYTDPNSDDDERPFCN